MEFVLLKRCECDFSVTVFLIWKWNAFHRRWQLLFRFEASRSAFWRQRANNCTMKQQSWKGWVIFWGKNNFFLIEKNTSWKKINFWTANWKPILESYKGWLWLGYTSLHIIVELKLNFAYERERFTLWQLFTLSKQEYVSFFPFHIFEFSVVPMRFWWLRALFVISFLKKEQLFLSALF